MAITEAFRRVLAAEMRLTRGRVVGVEPDGQLCVRLGAAGAPEIACDVLRAAPVAAGWLQVGNEVLVARGEGPGNSGVILGAIGPTAGFAAVPDAVPDAKVPEVSPPIPEDAPVIKHREIVIEAGDELTLRCGEASIRITRDGKIVIRGEHILSRAKGTQRIKGGSVAIN